jgi:hypothetical protein
MCPSPAFPTIAPANDSVTDQLIYMAHPGSLPPDDPEGVPLGLLPQLIEVLHALTEGHDALSRQLRVVRLEITNEGWLGPEESLSPHSESGTSFTEGAAPPVGGKIHSDVLAATLDQGAFPSTASVPLGHQVDQPGPRSVGKATDDDLPGAPVNRNYNFFDELDARLADLPDTSDPVVDG